ncbi:hypothetical protein 2019_scaffold132_00043 [Bacteriophage sp.]|nr:hypothetical protein 2019_scaffold132_00043 [Bacteriophage sp.]
MRFLFPITKLSSCSPPFARKSVQGDRFVLKNGGVLHEIRCQKTECQKEHKGKDYRKSKEAGQKGCESSLW